MEELGRRYGLAVNPKAKIWQLSIGEQQRVEIVKALYRDARVLIMDEPTAVLTPQEAEGLFATLRAMADEGKTVIFISHKLHEVKAVADQVTVLRGGKTVATVDAASATARSLASLMVGREVEVVRPLEHARHWRTSPCSTWTGRRSWATVARPPCAASRSRFAKARSSESRGSRETASASSPRLSGMRDIDAGSVRIAGRTLRGGDPREAILAGVAHVPEDRLGTGLAPSLSVTSNVVMKTYRRSLSHGPLLRSGGCARSPFASSGATT